MADELIVVERETALAAFNDEAAFENLFDAIKAKADEFVPDISNAKGRKEVASFAHKVTKTKTRIDGIRADLTEDMRAKVSAIDARGKVMRDRLDVLKEEVRRPLTEWETTEKARVERIQTAITTARELGQVKFGETSRQIQERIDKLPMHDLDWYAEFQDEAQLVIESAFNSLTLARTAAQNSEREALEREEQRKELERLRAAEEERRAEQEAAAATREAEERQRAAAARAAEDKIAAERAEMERERAELIRDKEAAEQAQRDAEARVVAAAEAERNRIERERIEAEEAERVRIAAEEEAERARVAAIELAAKQAEEAEEQKRRAAAELQERTDAAYVAAVQDLNDFLRSSLGQRTDKIACALMDQIKVGTINHVRFEV